MEMRDDDWKPEWDDAGRKAAEKMYGWRLGAVLVIAFIVIIGLAF